MQLIPGSPTSFEVRRRQILSLSWKKIVKIEHFSRTFFQDFGVFVDSKQLKQGSREFLHHSWHLIRAKIVVPYTWRPANLSGSQDLKFVLCELLVWKSEHITQFFTKKMKYYYYFWKRAKFWGTCVHGTKTLSWKRRKMKNKNWRFYEVDFSRKNIFSRAFRPIEVRRHLIHGRWPRNQFHSA